MMDTGLRREKLYEKMKDRSILILYSGVELHVSADEYLPFEANRNFFYLTGLRREHMILWMAKTGTTRRTILFIEEADPREERWTGHMLTKEEAAEASGIDTIYYTTEFPAYLSAMVGRVAPAYFYCDCSRFQAEDPEDYNLTRARELQAKYPAIGLLDLSVPVAELRMRKSDEEVGLIRDAVAITKKGLERVMRRLTPGMKEYQAQADFEYEIRYRGADGTSFPTIAGSGANGTMMHYETNQGTCADGSLLLLDLGAKYEGYCADITRTYPVCGKYSERQRKVYDVVLRANREVAKAARPGATLRELNEVATRVLAQGCIGLGLIRKESEIGKYYMHGVSHHLGIDVHDVTAPSLEKLEAGAVITDEPGLYIDEWEIGIRIEDDLLITEDGCEVLSADILRDPDRIEAYMAGGTDCE